MDNFIKPSLIEPGVKYFLNKSLEQCNAMRIRYYNLIYNLGLFFLLVLVVGFVLYIKYKHKNNKLLQEEKKRKEQEYLLNKLRFMQDYRKNQVNHITTDLPTWQNNPEVQFYNRKIFH